jgi:glycosyltransferase involved in cell wall biosynthesis
MSIEVSVIIPMYNAEGTIIKCLNSVLVQTYKDFEVIIIDDGSIDRSYEIVKDYLTKKNIQNLKLLKQNNRGPGIARNRGIKNSKGKYIAFLDADDIWRSNKLEIQMRYLQEDTNLKMIGSLTNNNISEKEPKIEYISFRRLLFSNVFTTSTVIIEKEILEKEDVMSIKSNWSEDYFLWMQIVKHYKAALLRSSLVIYENHKRCFEKSGLSAKLIEMEKGELWNYKELFKRNYYSSNDLINFLWYILLYCYSILKFIRRIIITLIKK